MFRRSLCSFLSVSLLFLAVVAQAQEVFKGVTYSAYPYAVGDQVTPLQTVAPGQEFELALSVTDGRPDGEYVVNGVTKTLVRGVFAAYIDVKYDTSFVQCLEVKHIKPYINGKQGFPAPDGLMRVGSFSSEFSGATFDTEFVRLRMKALKEGTIKFEFGTAHLLYPMDATLVYGNIAATPPEQSNVDPKNLAFLNYTLTSKAPAAPVPTPAPAPAPAPAPITTQPAPAPTFQQPTFQRRFVFPIFRR